MSEIYVISSSKFKTKEEALEQIKEWRSAYTLDKDARVYKVTKVYRPIFKEELEEEKLD